MICKKCGTKNSQNNTHCELCGARLANNPPFKIEREEEYLDIYSFSPEKKGKHSKQTKETQKNKKKKIIITVLISVIAVILAIAIGLFSWVISSLNNIDRTDLSSDLGISENVESNDKIKNILLFGIDSRKDDDTGRSDAIILLSIDKKHNKIKMTSLARDSYVKIDGHGKDKLTHAWAFGKAQKAIHTVNANFGTDVTDFVSINFFQFAEIIDYMGGVEIDVSEAEKKVMNRDYIPVLNELGIKCEKVTKTGMQLLTGGQALAYTRNRYTGGDIERGNRQKEVLSAMFDKMKNVSAAKYPEIINMLTEHCSTSLSNSDILGLGAWAVMSKPQIENLSLPNKACNAKGKTINGTWYYVYDLEAAKQEIVNFVYNDIKSEE